MAWAPRSADCSRSTVCRGGPVTGPSGAVPPHQREPSDKAILAASGWLPGDDPPTEHEWWQIKKALIAAYAVDFPAAALAPSVGAAPSTRGQLADWLEDHCHD